MLVFLKGERISGSPSALFAETERVLRFFSEAESISGNLVLVFLKSEINSGFPSVYF